jgi:hypothetical protein
MAGAVGAQEVRVLVAQQEPLLVVLVSILILRVVLLKEP